VAIDSRDKRFNFMRFANRCLDFPLFSGAAGLQTPEREHGAGFYLGFNYSPTPSPDVIGAELRSSRIGISIGF
jgi:hypothetical protein